MVFVKRVFMLLVSLVCLVAISACGSAPATTTTGSSAAPTSAPTPTLAPTPTAAANIVVMTAQATVAGKAETVLTNTKGMTLYYYTPDTSQSTACTGGCAQNWPPLLSTGTGAVAANSKLPGELEVYKNANGNQIIYNDHPLYTFIGDTAAGQFNGQGKGGKWFVATPDLAKNK